MISMNARINLLRGIPRFRGSDRLSEGLRRLLVGAHPETIEISVNNSRMRLHPRDAYCERVALYRERYFDPVELDFLRRTLPVAGTFVDLGTNVGLYSLFAAHTCGPDGRVLSVEADPYTFSKLQANIELNDYRQIIAVNCAVSDVEETASLSINPTNRGANSLVAETGNSIEVTCFPLADLLSAHGIDTIDVIKIDIEGMEYRTLSAFFSTAAERVWPRAIIAEINPEIEATNLHDLISAHGYTLQNRHGYNHMYVHNSASPGVA